MLAYGLGVGLGDGINRGREGVVASGVGLSVLVCGGVVVLAGIDCLLSGAGRL